MSDKYILNEAGEPEACEDFVRWANWFELNERHVACDNIKGVRVSTVFLGINHNWSEGPPVLWETMIFGGEHDEYQRRYTSRADAEAGHNEALALVLAEHSKPLPAEPTP